MLNAFCRVAPSVRFSLSAIRDARFFWRAIVFKVRTCSAVHARRFLGFFTIEQLPVSNKKVVAGTTLNKTEFLGTRVFFGRHSVMHRETKRTPRQGSAIHLQC